MVRFITFEGGDGTGKSTQIRALESYLVDHGYSCVITREPGGTALGKLIRKALLEVSGHQIASSTELFMYLADRAQHVSEVILPAIEAGKVVLCDRFTDSTMAYQGYGRGIEIRLLRQLNEVADQGLRPDLTFLFDCPASVGLGRTVRRKNETGRPDEDRFEREKIEFHEKVRAGFLKLAGEEPQRFRILDATRPIEEVTLAIRKVINEEML
jgi:dTMP kinase